MTNTIEPNNAFLNGETLVTPGGHKLSFLGYENGVYNIMIVRGAVRIEGWKTAAQACARADAMMQARAS